MALAEIAIWRNKHRHGPARLLVGKANEHRSRLRTYHERFGDFCPVDSNRWSTLSVFLSLLFGIPGACFVALWAVILIAERKPLDPLEQQIVTYLVNLEPRRAARFYVGLILLATLAFVLYWLFSKEEFPNVCTEFSCVVGLLSFGYIVQDLLVTRAKAEEVRIAADKAAVAEREKHYRYCLNEATILLAQASIGLGERRWRIASWNLSHLQRLLTNTEYQKETANRRWLGFAGSMGYWSNVFHEGRDQEALRFDEDAWHDTHEELTSALQQLLADEFVNGETDNAA
jgi:hypothetical protein